jgi:hypothetical protein
MELHDLYSSPIIVRVIKSIMRLSGHITLMGAGRGMYRRNLREKYHWRDPDVDGRIILKCNSDGVGRGMYRRNLREKDHWRDPDVDGRIILKWILKK